MFICRRVSEARLIRNPQREKLILMPKTCWKICLSLGSTGWMLSGQSLLWWWNWTTKIYILFSWKLSYQMSFYSTPIAPWWPRHEAGKCPLNFKMGIGRSLLWKGHRVPASPWVTDYQVLIRALTFKVQWKFSGDHRRLDVHLRTSDFRVTSVFIGI